MAASGTRIGPGKVDLQLPPDSEAPARARAAVRDILGAAETGSSAAPGSPSGSVLLLVSEVVTNAVLHCDKGASAAPLRLTAGIEGEAIHVAVTDSGHGFPDDAKQFAGGYGPFLLQKLATRWGVEPAQAPATSSTVWFELSLREPPPAAEAPTGQ